MKAVFLLVASLIFANFAHAQDGVRSRSNPSKWTISGPPAPPPPICIFVNTAGTYYPSYYGGETNYGPSSSNYSGSVGASSPSATSSAAPSDDPASTYIAPPEVSSYMNFDDAVSLGKKVQQNNVIVPASTASLGDIARSLRTAKAPAADKKIQIIQDAHGKVQICTADGANCHAPQ